MSTLLLNWCNNSLVYKSFIQSVFIFCFITWSGNVYLSNKNRLDC